MAFRSFPVKPSTPFYPTAEVILQYLRDYANYFDIRKFIRLQSLVEKCEWSESNRVWTVKVKTSESQTSHKITTHEFDKLIIANGHFLKPRYPAVPGLLDWLRPPDPQTEPRATHSVYFRNPTPYKGKRVVVVGGGPSGADITAEVCKFASVVYHSMTGAVPSSTTMGGCILINRGRVTAFHENRTVSFDDAEADTPSTVLDHAILATGYEMDFPFIKPPILEKGKGDLFKSNALPSKLVNTTYSIYPLTRHILPITEPVDQGLPWGADPSALAFVGLFIRVAPFPLFETQALYLISLYRNPNIFSFSLEKRWVEDRYNYLKKTFGTPSLIAKKIHVFSEGIDQYTYATELLDLAGVPKDSGYYPEHWNVEVYEAKDILRRIWRMLEKKGKAEEIVHGVGSAPGRAGREEWAKFARMLIREYGSEVWAWSSGVRFSTSRKYLI